MEWLILEALVSVALGLAIVWWALSPARKRDRQEEMRAPESGAGTHAPGEDRRT